MPPPDHYSTLGVLPSAEIVVIRAAYRALAQRYHPDRWSGDPAEAHRRMSAINEAFGVLNDEALRAKYDATRPTSDRGEYRSTVRDEYEQAFGAAMTEQESRWALAVEIFPDLAAIRADLGKTSAIVAFSFVTTLLETKNYNERRELAAVLERAYLERYFGTDPEVLSYAKELIAAGNRKAAQKLNQLVDVMGSQVESGLLIQRVEQEYGVRAERARRHAIDGLTELVLREGGYDASYRLAMLLGYSVNLRGRGFLGSTTTATVTSASHEVKEFSSMAEFVKWVQATLCAKT